MVTNIKLADMKCHNLFIKMLLIKILAKNLIVIGIMILSNKSLILADRNYIWTDFLETPRVPMDQKIVQKN